ncbi:MAG: siderophore-interacting protein [Microbacteriaceae bacterium]
MLKREIVRHELAVRVVTVQEKYFRTESMLAVRVAGAALHDFISTGPGDHMKVFFPDPASGVLTPPYRTEDGSIQRPDNAVSINRDYTPLRFQSGDADTPPSLEIEFLIHDNPGPATTWAIDAKSGDELALVGPRGSKMVPQDVDRVLLIGDETTLPSISRWIALLPAEVKISALVQAENETIDDYFSAEERSRTSLEWLYREDGPGQLIEAVRSARELISDRTYVWAGGEAGELIAVRRFLKYELALNPENFHVEGYWRQGVTNHDHHSPLDQSDPD